MSEPSVPKISVVIPTYNRAAALGRCLGSVLGQTFRDLEVIVADDASTDDTEAVVRGLGDPRVRYVRRPARGGGGAARNTGIREARAALVAFQDSDDTWKPEKLALQLAKMESAPATVGVVYCGLLRHRRGHSRVVPEMGYLEGDVHQDVLFGNFVGTQTALVRTAALREVGGFDESLPRLQDWDLWLRVSRRHHFLAVKEVLVEAEAHAEDHARFHRSITEDSEALVRAYERMLAKYADELDRAPEAKKRHLTIAANAALAVGARRRALGYAAKSLIMGAEKSDVSLVLRSIAGPERVSRLQSVVHRLLP